MTLALLLTAVTGAWADEPNVYNSGTVDLRTLKVGDILMSGVTLVHEIESWDGLELDVNRYAKDGITQTSTPQDVGAPTIGENGQIEYQSTTYTPVTEGGEAGGAWVVLSIVDASYSVHNYKNVSVGGIEPPLTVEWNASTKTGTFAMPGSDVVLTPIYAQAATFATTGTGSEATTLLPAAAEGVIAGTDASLIAEGTGIVAFAGTSTEVTQGTLMYAVGTSDTQAPALTDFSATAPTAKNVADDGATVYVWYYIQGADAPEGDAATLDNTFDDTEPACLTVTVLSNKFDIQFNAANANTIEAGKATVTVAGAAATVTDGKLQGVKMGSEVKVKANTGYKFRKVEVKKGSALKTLTVTGVTTKSINYAEGDTWQQAIERPENAGSGWSVLDIYILNGGYMLLINGGGSTYVYVRPGDTIDATKNYSLEAD